MTMKKFKKYLRLITIILFITLAASAGGLFGVPIITSRQNDPENRPKIEMVDKEEETDEEEENKGEEKA